MAEDIKHRTTSPLSRLAETLVGSEIVRLGNEISNRVRNGEKIYNYTIGDFDPQIFPIPAELEAGVIDSYRNKHTNYPPADGIAELRTAISHYIKEDEGLDYAPNEIQVASGGRPLIYSFFRMIVDKGDKVIYAVPSWNNNHYTHICEGEHCMIEALPENNFMPLANDIAPHLKGAVLLCICTPQNPTGTVFDKTKFETICDLVLEENSRRGPGEKKLYVMFDQMYYTLTYGDTKHYDPVSLRPEMRDYTVYIDGMSKSFAATGVRVGWAFGPIHIISKMKAILSHLGGWAPMPEQKATAAFLQNRAAIDKYRKYYKAELEERLWSIYNGIIKLKDAGFDIDAIAPQAAIYLTVKLNLAGKKHGAGILETQTDVTDYILSEAKLAIVPFYAFGAERNSPWYRISVGTCKKEEIGDMLAKLEAALQKLN